MNVSVIIPVYNAEATLDKCLQSILKQDTKFNYEVICIDDASSDSSLAILRTYKDKIKIIEQSSNRGPGPARNKGIKEASGDYLMFIDSDDYVSSNFVDKMYQTALDYEAEMVICNFVRVEEDKKVYVNKGEFNIYEKGSINEVLLMEFHSCNRIIKKDIMTLYPDILYEDVVSISKTAIRAKKIVKIEDYLYYYVYRDGSTTRTLDERNLDILKAYERINDDFIKNNYQSELEFLYVNGLLVDLFIKLVKVGKMKEAKKIKKDVEKVYPNWYQNKYLKEVKLSKRLYLFCLKHDMYRTIERVFRR